MDTRQRRLGDQMRRWRQSRPLSSQRPIRAPPCHCSRNKKRRRENRTPTRAALLHTQINRDHRSRRRMVGHQRQALSERSACRAYFQQRISAVPLQIRDLLIERYCPKTIQTITRSSRENEDCLIRIYTCKRRRQVRPPTFFNLRNYRLHVDQINELGLDTGSIVKILAEALAHCYWRAHVDAHDVEFVFAPTCSTQSSTPTFKLAGLEHELFIWMLGYDCVREMEQSEEDIRRAVHAFYQNDSYFPRPHFYGHTQDDVDLWGCLRSTFWR